MSEDYELGYEGAQEVQDLPVVEDASAIVQDEGTAVAPEEVDNDGFSDIINDGDKLLRDVGYVGPPIQWDTFDPNVKTEHVYHHSEEKVPYGSLNVDETPRGRTTKIEIKNVTPDNLGVALALYASLESLGAEEQEAAKEEIEE